MNNPLPCAKKGRWLGVAVRLLLRDYRKKMSELENKEQYLSQLRAAIKQLHGCDARHLESVAIKEEFRGRTVWEGAVEVFAVVAHPKAKVCYAWSYRDKTSDKERIAAILGLRLIPSARDAVKTFIMAENRKHFL